MLSVKHTSLYKEVVKELNYKFGDVFVFDGFVISEIKEGVSFSWDEHAKRVIEDVTEITKCNGSDLIYLSHRIHSYSLVPQDWLKFFKNSFSLKGYGVIGYQNISFVNTVIENLFFNKKIRRFSDLNQAIQWVKSFDLVEVDN
ncbi:hypothetical protein H8K90_11055 [Winogradskyella echinorum]|uniref:SpoIIAA-like n=1 Tax=Winogradskyella echinorum TaxID=538189 RepID=A0ABR6Y2L8_9FLAO|nr:hypothetical protein [Winogradskyella echinorum]MBC3846919.1 hypothetical protein [Winogradskyella echinorum]MBC5751267.1 hypothetical protein [Winogradskyella echinorum]